MLHDPHWNHGTLSGLITWLGGKPRNETYDYADGSRCLVRQYMDLRSVEFHLWPEEMLSIYRGQDEYRIAAGGPEVSPRRTYGAALERAREAQAAQIVREVK